MCADGKQQAAATDEAEEFELDEVLRSLRSIRAATVSCHEYLQREISAMCLPDAVVNGRVLPDVQVLKAEHRRAKQLGLDSDLEPLSIDSWLDLRWNSGVSYPL